MLCMSLTDVQVCSNVMEECVNVGQESVNVVQ